MNKWNVKLFLIILVVTLLATSVVFTAYASGTTTPAKTTEKATATTTAAKTEQKTEQSIILKLSAHGPPTGGNEKVMQQWADTVAQKTGGRVKVECYFGGALSSAPDAWTNTVKRVVDIAFVPYAEIASTAPLSALLETPTLGFTGARQATWVLNELIKTNPAVAKEWAPVKVIATWMANPRWIHTSKKAVNVPGDLKGTKILSWTTVATAMEMMGATPLQLPPPDWFTSINTNLCGGIVTSGNTVNMFKVDTITPYHTNVDMGFAGLSLVMNLDVWKSLPADVQKMLDTDINPWGLEEQIKTDERLVASISDGWVKKGQSVIKPNADQLKLWSDAIVPVHQKVLKDYAAKGLPGQEIYDTTLKLIKAYIRK